MLKELSINRVGKHGSALIAALIIASSIGLIIAGLGRFVSSSIRTTSNFEDAMLAFAAAEAGIEDGLLRWRFNRDIQLPELSGLDMQESIKQAVRVNLTTGSVTGPVALGEGIASNSTDSVYDLRIWYKAPTVGSTDPTALTSSNYPFRLAKDQTLDLNAQGLRGKAVQLDYAIPAPNQQVVMECRIIREDIDGTLTTEKIILSQPSDRKIICQVPSGSDGLGYRLRFKPFILSTTGGAAPDNSFINYALSVPGAADNRNDALLDTGVTIIESTGYYGSAKRTLQARIDRASGTVLGIFDYVLFSNQDIE